MANYPSSNEIAEMVKRLTDARIENWLGEALGCWQWWFLVIVFILPWFTFYLLADRKKLLESVLMLFLVMIFSITLDEMGFSLSFWNYPIQLIPIFPTLTSIDYSVLPVTYALIYQYCPNWKSFFKGMICVALIDSFIIEPMLVRMGLYVMLKWSHGYSFPIYILMGTISRWIVCKIIDIRKPG